MATSILSEKEIAGDAEKPPETVKRAQPKKRYSLCIVQEPLTTYGCSNTSIFYTEQLYNRLIDYSNLTNRSI
jgi:hypothetical protein